MEPETVVLDRDDMRRSLARVAHEIVEKNPAGELAIVGVHRRGAPLARRIHALVGELRGSPLPLREVAIVASTDTVQSTCPAACVWPCNTCRIRSKVPSLDQALKRCQTVCHFGKRSGRSRHGDPVRNRQITASKTSR